MFGLDVHLAARQGDLARAREQLARLIPAMAEEGYAAPSQVHDLLAGCLAGGMTPDELRPLVDLVGVIPGHRLDADHPFRQLIDAQLAEGDGDIETAARLYAAAADSSTDIAVRAAPAQPGHRARRRGSLPHRARRSRRRAPPRRRRPPSC